MKIASNRLDRIFAMYQSELEQKTLDVLRSGWYVLGNEVKSFENEFSTYITQGGGGGYYCVGLASGLDALWIAFKLLGINKGDEVIVQGNTYIASVMGITINDALPVFIEPDKHFALDKIEGKITSRTRAILVTHLYGMASQMDKIMELCRKYNLKLVEDCAQSHGAKFRDKFTGTFGDVGCFSFYPTKNLGACGDAGAVIVKDKNLADKFKIFRNYGSEKRYHNKIIGANSRLDEIQAGLLRVKLRHLDELNAEKIKLAEIYSREINNSQIILPEPAQETFNVWHQYVIRCEKRDKLIDYLKQKDIESIIHYPIPSHLSEAYKYLVMERGSLPITEKFADTVLSIPIYNGMTELEQEYIIDAINKFQ